MSPVFVPAGDLDVPAGFSKTGDTLLSTSYVIDGKPTMDDPSSYEGEEKRRREDALLEQAPATGYAGHIRSKRGLPFFPLGSVSVNKQASVPAETLSNTR